jgi:hypothetical protein
VHSADCRVVPLTGLDGARHDLLVVCGRAEPFGVELRGALQRVEVVDDLERVPDSDLSSRLPDPATNDDRRRRIVRCNDDTGVATTAGVGVPPQALVP